MNVQGLSTLFELQIDGDTEVAFYRDFPTTEARPIHQEKRISMTVGNLLATTEEDLRRTDEANYALIRYPDGTTQILPKSPHNLNKPLDPSVTKHLSWMQKQRMWCELNAHYLVHAITNLRGNGVIADLQSDFSGRLNDDDDFYDEFTCVTLPGVIRRYNKQYE